MSQNPELIITVATKSECPSQVVHATIQALESGILNKLPITKNVLFIITGVGPKAIARTSKWIKANLSPLYILNIGTAIADLPIGTWINSINNRHPELVSGSHPIDHPLATPYDMEYQYLKEEFPQAQYLKMITDRGDPLTYQKSLPQYQIDLKTHLNWLNPDPIEFSVIIPTHNRAHTLKACIDSVLAQTHPPKEIIIIDDASTDTTQEILSHYAKIKTIRLQKNKGVSHARNQGIKAATGNWLAFLDSDDTWAPEKLHNQATYIRTHPYYQLLQSEEIWIRNGKRVNQLKHHQKQLGWQFEAALNQCTIAPSSVIIKKELLGSNPFDETLPACEDYDLWLRLTRHHPVGLEPSHSLIKTGGHPDQLSQKYPAMDRFRIQALEKALHSESDPITQEKIKTVLERKKAILKTGAKKRQNPIWKERAQ